ncbi:MAG: type III effector HopL1 [Desulfovibrionaceae bacterium]|nr:type III effector HopL1 [Desulfovibrionaceae bacterium]
MSLFAACEQVRAACAEAQGWVLRNTDSVRNEEEGLIKELRKSARLVRRIGFASTRKMCAGVFGPSQAGKSYLISALARDEEGSLLALFGSEKHDFIQEINPEGGKESTGLVTRFTLTRPTSLPDGYPVQIRLLSETDLVKILANTYYADCEHKEEAESSIEAVLKELEGRTGEGSPTCDLDALEELREYLYRDFRSKARVQLLERSYWDRALALGPSLGLEDRVTLYSLLWDAVPEFTDLLLRLVRALASLGYPDQAFCSVQALIPREGSIIDVATLEGLEVSHRDASDTESQKSLTVVTLDGKRAVLPRSYVTALTAELTIVMDGKPAEYFETTDLLDFPGYRSRYKIDNIRRELAKEGMLKEMFLRGKVAYLFQRFVHERELTSMLLCIGPSNQEVQDLPGVINDWICATHGDRPELREHVASSLFLILTKFDMEFEQKKGAPSVESRWDNRLHASLLDFFGKQHDWPREWNMRGAFNNLFLLRNPNFRFDAVLEYSPQGQEKGIRPEMLSYVKELERAFMQSELVARHFANPRVAWDSAMRLNDGGIRYIRESLAPICNPSLKEAQLAQSLAEVCRSLVRRLKGFYRSDNREELLKQKYALIKVFYQRLGALEKNYQRMGLLLRACTITDAEIFDMYGEAYRRFLDQPEEQACANETPLVLPDIDIADTNVEDWNPFADTSSELSDGTQPNEPKDNAERDEAASFADCIESAWIERLHALADDPAMQKFFHLTGPEFTALVSELATGCARLGIRDAMLRDFRKASAYVNTQKESIVWQQSSMAAHAINSYVAWLGLNPHTLSDAERSVQVGGKSQIVFAEQRPWEKLGEGALMLHESRTNYLSVYYRDWLTALYALIIGNVNFDGERAINVEENMKLGSLLAVFAKGEKESCAARS